MSVILSCPRDGAPWFDEISAVTPFGPKHRKPGLHDTHPFSL